MSLPPGRAHAAPDPPVKVRDFNMRNRRERCQRAHLRGVEEGVAIFAFLVRLIHWITFLIPRIRRTKFSISRTASQQQKARPMDHLDETPTRRATDLIASVTAHAAELRPVDVRTIRRRLGFTQAQFAGYFGFAVATLRHWERGNRKPAGTALVLLHVIAHHPRAVLLAARQARATLGAAAMPKVETSRSRRAPPGLGSPM